MRIVCLVALLALLTPPIVLTQAPAQQNPTRAAGVGVIRGIVERAGGSTAISGAQVTILSSGATGGGPPARGAAQRFSVTITSDASGHFETGAVPAGAYSISVQREGYFGVQARGAFRAVATNTPTAGGLPISGVPARVAPSAIATAQAFVTAGETTNITVKMVQAGTINGRITDPNGQPLVGSMVTAFQLAYQDGTAVLRPVVSTESNDRGEYRLFWLSAGEYYVGVTPQRAYARGAAVVSRTYYHPGVAEALAAVRIKVDSGIDVAGINLFLQTQLEGVTISGDVVNLLPTPYAGRNGQAEVGARLLYLIPFGPTLMEANPPSLLNPGSRVGTQFQIAGVLPGSYELIALVSDAQNSPVPGRTRIEVGDRDLSGVTIPVRPGGDVRGRIVTSASIPSQNIRVQLREIDGGFPSVISSILTATTGRSSASRGGRGNRGGAVQPDPAPTVALAPEEFLIPNVPDGKYALQVSLPANAYIEDIREGGRSIYDSGLIVAGTSPSELQVIANTNSAAIWGTVVDRDRKPVENALVILVPAEPRRQNLSLYKTALSGWEGEFSLPGVAPGNYKLFAWEDIPDGAYQNAEFMKKYEFLGVPVTMVRGVRVDSQVRVIPTER